MGVAYSKHIVQLYAYFGDGDLRNRLEKWDKVIRSRHVVSRSISFVLLASPELGISLANLLFVASKSVEMCFGYENYYRRRPQDSFEFGGKSALEDLPQEILIKILCGVEHDDLKKLLFVSKSIKEATLVAKESHFAFSTPKKTVGFQKFDFFNDSIEIEAPKQSRVPRRRLSPKKLTDISVALFS
ncbi:hypothetical protein ACS0TY_031900 [Phlomoides rotata]